VNLAVHPDTYSSPRDLLIEAGVVIVLALLIWLLTPKGFSFVAGRREKIATRRFNRRARHMIDRERR
jgi:hypothetical protein